MKEIISMLVRTSRLDMNIYYGGRGIPVLFIHGNASSAAFWEDILKRLPRGYRVIAPDLRGYGKTDDKLIDATQGFSDWVKDISALLDLLRLEKFHVVGHSMGAGILYELLPALESGRILSATFVCPASPFGVGGTKDAIGTPCYSDFAGSGAGLVNKEFARLIGEKYRGEDYPFSPRTVMNSYYWKTRPSPLKEERLLSSILTTKIGPQKYPGDIVPSKNWPGFAPGLWGPANALSPKYAKHRVANFLSQRSKPPLLWVRGTEDTIVSDESLIDPGYLAIQNLIPNWPGPDIYPPQPMLRQIRCVFEAYRSAGGKCHEKVMRHAGHSPHIEKPIEFVEILMQHIKTS